MWASSPTLKPFARSIQRTALYRKGGGRLVAAPTGGRWARAIHRARRLRKKPPPGGGGFAQGLVAAAATVVVVAAAVVAAAAAAAAEDQQQDDDPPDVAAEASIVTAHKEDLRFWNFIEL